ncbi:MAG TPA: hypothetical protein VGH19_14025 [Verrucomicrobiae bacterium]
MKIYWDSSALLLYWLEGREREIKGVTRVHSLVEVFGTITGRGIPQQGGTFLKLEADLAARVLADIAGRLEYVELDTATVLKALKEAKKRAVRGGRIHDYMHALAAEKAGAEEIWTTDANDFTGLSSIPFKDVSK